MIDDVTHALMIRHARVEEKVDALLEQNEQLARVLTGFLELNERRHEEQLAFNEATCRATRALGEVQGVLVDNQKLLADRVSGRFGERRDPDDPFGVRWLRGDD